MKLKSILAAWIASVVLCGSALAADPVQLCIWLGPDKQLVPGKGNPATWNIGQAANPCVPSGIPSFTKDDFTTYWDVKDTSGKYFCTIGLQKVWDGRSGSPYISLATAGDCASKLGFNIQVVYGWDSGSTKIFKLNSP